MKIAVATLSVGLFLCLSAPAIAGPREKFDLAISSQGYDLTDPSQVNKLRRQIDLAVIEACNPSDRLSEGPMPDLKCRRELRRDAAIKIAALTESARANRMAGL